MSFHAPMPFIIIKHSLKYSSQYRHSYYKQCIIKHSLYKQVEKGRFMEEIVLEIITQALTEDRMSEILHQHKDYQEAKQDEDKLYDLLMGDLTDVQKKRVDAFIDAATWTATLGEKYAYQQGMKDFLSLLKALSKNERCMQRNG
jgi:hypothetical protein